MGRIATAQCSAGILGGNPQITFEIHTQGRLGEGMAQKATAHPHTFHADIGLMVEDGGAILSQHFRETASARSIHERAGIKQGN